MLRKPLYLVALSALFGSFVACKGGSDTGDTDDTADTDDTDHQGDGVSPYLTSGRIWCEMIGGTANVMTWFIEAEAEDPQGAHTIVRFPNYVGGYTAQGEAEIFYAGLMVCEGGECEGTFREEDYGVLCDTPDNYIFKAVVIDDDGNESPPYVLPFDPP